MELSVKKEKEELIVYVSGRVDTTTAPEFERTVEENAEGVSQLIFDLSKTVYVSSAGLRVFLKMQKTMTKLKGTMKLVNPNDDVYEILEMTGFTDIMTVER